MKHSVTGCCCQQHDMAADAAPTAAELRIREPDDMRRSGAARALKLGAIAAAITVSAVACGGSAAKTASTDSSMTSSTTAPAPLPSPTASLPPGCHGMAVDLETTVAVLTDGIECPGSVNRYWHEQFGELWTEPTFIAYRDGEIPATTCAEGIDDPEEFEQNAFYCPADDTISYSEDLLDMLYEEGGPYLPVVVLEHELGHRADAIARTTGVISRSEENQADCNAGVTTAYARTAHRLPFSDVVGAARLLYKLGDTRNFGSEIADSPDAHGSPSQRVIAFSRGYFQDINTCRLLGRSDTGDVSDLN